MKKLKENKLLLAVIIMAAIIVISIITVIIMITSGGGHDEYGNRLSGIENYAVGENQISDLKSTISSFDSVKNVDYRLQGRIVNITIELDNNIALDTAKEYANKTLEYFDEDQKGFYDIQVFLTTKEESETYPVIGYKNKTSNELVWKK
mgnify:CR=1 FL=1